MIKKFGLALGLAAVVLLSGVTSASWSAEVVARVVAVVGDEVITSQDLDKMVTMLKAQLESSGNTIQSAEDIAKLRRLALDRLIGEKVFADEVKKQNIMVRESELDAFITRIRESNGLSEDAFVARLNQRGLSLAEYREQLRQDILRRRLISQSVKERVVISDAQIDEYYQKHMGAMASMGGVNIQALFIMVPPDAPPAAQAAVLKKTQGLRQQVIDGADFGELAKKHSQGPGKDKGGRLGPLKADDLLPAMRQALAEMKPGDISTVMEIPGGYAFMKLLDRSGKSDLAPAEVREQIREKLEKEAFDRLYAKWLKELRAKSYIRIMAQ